MKNNNDSIEVQNNRFLVTEKAVRPEGEKGRCFSCNQEIGEEHDMSCESIKKVVGITLFDWFQISVPNSFNEKEIMEKADSVSEAVCAFLAEYLWEQERENLKDFGGDIHDYDISPSLYLSE